MTSRDSGENSTIVNLQASQTFTGRVVEAGGFTKCGVSVLCDRPIRLQIYQSISGSIVDKVDVYEIEASTIPEPHTEFAPKRRAVELNYRYFYITARNTGETASTTCRIQTQLYNDGFLDHAHDRVALWGQDASEVQHPVQTTSTGDLIINGSAGSATRPVYLMEVGTFYRVASVGNTAGHVWTSIGAIVGGESEPTIGRFFKCLYVPANVEGQGTVYDVEFTDTLNVVSVGGVQAVSGTVSVDNFPAYQSSIEVSNFPATQAISGSVALLPAVDPTLTVGTVRLTDTYGSPVITSSGNLMVGISQIYTVNPLHTIVDSGSITTTESASLIASFTESSGKGNIKTSAGSLQSLSIVNDNTALAFVALYNATSGNVIVGTTAPLAVLVIQKNQAIQLAMNNLAFSTAICFFVATAYNGGTELGNVYLTASYN